MTKIASLVSDTKVLKMGDSGPDVVALQLALKQLGYALTGTGYFGSATDTAVEAAQRRFGFGGKDVDGRVGPRTAAMIDAAVEMPTMVHQSPAEEISRPLWVEAGLKFIGTHEGVGTKDNKVIIDWAKDEGGDIAQSYTHDSIPWCALYANMTLTRAGLKGPETLWALDFNSDMMKQRVGHGWPAVKLIGPAVGAFAPMLRNGGGHIVIVVGKDQHGNIMGLGGNQSDQVSIIPFPVARLNKGFWWPATVPVPSRIGLSSLPVVRSDGKVSSKES